MRNISDKIGTENQSTHSIAIQKTVPEIHALH
jgi:hypothetical protein